MGIEYYVVDKGQKTFYELGSGSWLWSGEDLICNLSDVDALKAVICGAYQLSMKHSVVPMLPDDYSYCWWMAEDLNKHFGASCAEDVVIVSDAGASSSLSIIKSKGYRCLGSRHMYNIPGEDLEKELGILNRHFDKKGNVTRDYDWGSDAEKIFPGYDYW